MLFENHKLDNMSLLIIARDTVTGISIEQDL